jgi:hypothetical protein
VTTNKTKKRSKTMTESKTMTVSKMAMLDEKSGKKRLDSVMTLEEFVRVLAQYPEEEDNLRLLVQAKRGELIEYFKVQTARLQAADWTKPVHVTVGMGEVLLRQSVYDGIVKRLRAEPGRIIPAIKYVRESVPSCCLVEARNLVEGIRDALRRG